MPANNDQIMDILRRNPIEGMDYDDGLNRFGNQASVYMRIINTFIKNTPQLLTELSQVSKDNLADYTVKVHGLKGSCYGISAMDLGDEAKTLEFASRDFDWDVIKRENPVLIEHVNAFIVQLKSLLEKVERAESSSVDDRPLVEKPDTFLVERLLEATQDYDVMGIEATLKEMDKLRYRCDPKLVQELMEDFTDFKYESIVKKAQQLL